MLQSRNCGKRKSADALLDDALAPWRSQIRETVVSVELRFFGGMSVKATAEVLALGHGVVGLAEQVMQPSILSVGHETCGCLLDKPPHESGAHCSARQGCDPSEDDLDDGSPACASSHRPESE